MGIVYEEQHRFMIISCLVLLRMENILDKNVEKIKTHILYIYIFFFSKIWQLMR
jgi:hypothetical protein